MLVHCRRAEMRGVMPCIRPETKKKQCLRTIRGKTPTVAAVHVMSKHMGRKHQHKKRKEKCAVQNRKTDPPLLLEPLPAEMVVAPTENASRGFHLCLRLELRVAYPHLSRFRGGASRSREREEEGTTPGLMRKDQSQMERQQTKQNASGRAYDGFLWPRAEICTE